MIDVGTGTPLRAPLSPSTAALLLVLLAGGSNVLRDVLLAIL